jgi:hypothetical protein
MVKPKGVHAAGITEGHTRKQLEAHTACWLQDVRIAGPN